MITIVLVRPQMGENIGAAARVMSNFGISDLRIVAPRDGWPNEKAIAMSAHGEKIIANAKIFSTLPQALAGLTKIYATTAKPRDMSKPSLTPRAIAEKDLSNTAFVFGPERTGLENEDIVYAQEIIEIPTCSENPSLNLAQAVGIIAYECRVTPSNLKKASEFDDLADTAELQGFFNQLENALDKKNYFREAARKTVMWQNLRSLFVKANLSKQEVRTLRGVVRSLTQ